MEAKALPDKLKVHLVGREGAQEGIRDHILEGPGLRVYLKDDGT